MIDICNLKSSIETQTLSDYLIVFLGDNGFLINQYIAEISAYKKKKLVYIDDLTMFEHDTADIFDIGVIDPDVLYVYQTPELDYSNKHILQNKNLFIITPKLSDASKAVFDNNLVQIPALEHWCIKDYVYSNLVGISTQYLDWLLDVTKYDVNRLQLEIDKFKIFPKTQRQKLFEAHVAENGFSDLSSYTIFNLTNAIITKNIAKLLPIIKEIRNIDVNAIGFVKVLHDNFKNIIQIQLDSTATADTLRINPRQFVAIRYNCGYYTSSQLLTILKILDSIDLQLKSGVLPVDQIVDYVILKILGV